MTGGGGLAVAAAASSQLGRYVACGELPPQFFGGLGERRGLPIVTEAETARSLPILTLLSHQRFMASSVKRPAKIVTGNKR